MFADYLDAAMQHARYEQIEDGTYFGSIDELPGSWVNAPTLEECKQKMAVEAEEWILFALVRNDELPEFDGHTLTYPKARE